MDNKYDGIIKNRSNDINNEMIYPIRLRTNQHKKS